jgi:hypothetical protein
MLRSAQHDTSPRFSLTSGAPLLVVAIVCALASAAIWLGPGILNTRAGGDSPFLLIRTHELAANLRAGVFPARWMPDAAYGLGYPFFNFYASLPYYLAAALTVLGVDMLIAIKFTQTIGMFAAGFAMLGWARTIYPQPLKGSSGDRIPWAATLAACAYVLAPFHLVNVYVRGDSLSEFWAFVWFPLILWGVQGVVVGKRWSVIGLALSLAALVLTHNVSALIFAPFIVIYGLAWLIRNARQSDAFAPSCLRGAIWLGVAALLALALSAWFWLPALAEAPAVQLGDQTTGYFNYANHFRLATHWGWAANLVQPSLAFDYAVNENGDAFAMGLLQTALVVIGAVVWWWSSRRAKRSHFELVLMLALFALATFMITPLSEFIWARAPLLPLTQFPWRFLSVQAVFAAVLIGGVGIFDFRLPIFDLDSSGNRQWIVVILTTTVLTWCALARLPNERLNIVAGDVTPRTIQLYEWYTGNIGTTIRGEYLPETALPRPYVGPDLFGMPRLARISQDGVAPDVASSMSSQLVSSTPTRQEWNITTTHDAIQITLPLFYSTAWREAINGTSSDSISFLTPNAGSGWAQVYLQKAGKNTVVLKYVGTSEQDFGNFLSLIAFVAIAIFFCVSVVRRRSQVRLLIRPAIPAIAYLGALLSIFVFAAYIFQPRGEDLPTLHTLDFAKRPFSHRDPVVFRAADGASYELIGASTGDPLRAGDALTLSLRWRDDRAPAAITVTQELPMGGEFANLFRYAREQSGGDPRLSTHVVPSNTLPGPLLLKLQASDANGNLLTPFNPDGSALTTEIAGKQVPAITLLGPSVTETPPNAAPPHLHTFANGIALHKMDWLFASEQEVCFRPIWTWARDDVNRADALQVSLRLRGSDGREIATADGQPQAGLAPTWSWPAGVLINDGRCVPVQNLLNLGEPYTLQIVWYRLANLEQVAEVTLHGTMSATLREDMNVPRKAP